MIPILILSLLLSACATKQDGPPKHDIKLSRIRDAIPKVEPKSRYGNNSVYVVNGREFHVSKSAKGYDQCGFASWYGRKFHGHLTATRERFSMYGMTAASRTLPIPTYVHITNLENGKTAVVKVNDRGPFNVSRIIDLSYAAAKKLGFAHKGVAWVRVISIDPRHYKKSGTHHHSHHHTSHRHRHSASPQPSIPTPLYLSSSFVS